MKTNAAGRHRHSARRKVIEEIEAPARRVHRQAADIDGIVRVDAKCLQTRSHDDIVVRTIAYWYGAPDDRIEPVIEAAAADIYRGHAAVFEQLCPQAGAKGPPAVGRPAAGEAG
jgi:hypothetical protein